MITTPDGAIDVNGRSQPLGGPADQKRLIALRGHSSVVIVGAGTMRTENYGVPSKPGLRIGVVSLSCNLDFAAPLFTSGSGFIIATTDAPEVPVDSIRAGVGKIDFAAVIAQLPDGMIHVEGGPQLNAALFNADVVDAINLTWSPRLVGSRGPSLSQAPHELRNFSLVSVTTQEEFVFARYERKKIASLITTA